MQGLWFYFIIITLGIGVVYILRWMGKPSLNLKRVIIVNNLEDCRNVTRTLVRKCVAFPALGFDCEWVTLPSGRRPVALLQLASVDGVCALVRLNKLQGSDSLSIPSELKALLEDSSVLKVGVAPSDDANYLLNDYGIMVRGCLDLRHVMQRIGGMPHGGLSGLAESVLEAKMDKSWSIRCSNWEVDDLSERQISYAANDAWFAVKILQVFAFGRLKLSDCCILDWLKSYWNPFSGIPPFAWGYVDVKYKKKAMTLSEDVNEIQMESSISTMAVVKQKPSKATKALPRAFCTRQTPLYHNCFMQAPDGAVLCTCDKKKAVWYVSKNLAELISENPLTVRLKFEPSGRAVGTVGQYYVQPKANCCVVCGKIDNCIRKNVVPHEYRKHFPKVMKDHVSHDVLLLCLPCHLRSNSFDLSLKRQLAELCSAPFCQGGNAKFTVNREKSAVKAAAKALLRSCDMIPEERQQMLRLVVKEYYGASELTDDVLEEAASMNAHTPNEDYDPHGMKIVQFFSIEDNGGLVKLEQMWREHFLSTMNPKYMPDLWSVTHTQDRLAIRASENRVLADELCVAGMKDCVSLLEIAQNERECKKHL
ncbi:Werner Syndrome-like exonuclease [Gryllus bimaculatus]|nr:Werner Syndrome-like exonuclease [Gryllus bimaculatus]